MHRPTNNTVPPVPSPLDLIMGVLTMVMLLATTWFIAFII